VPVEAADFPSESADIVVFWHVLEHLGEPGAALRRARNWLSPGGRLVVAVPNRNSLQAKLGGDRWFHQDVPRHRVQFTETGLLELLKASGYQPERARHLMLDQNPLGMWLTLMNRVTIERDVPFRLLKRALRYERRGDAIRDAVIVVIGSLPLLLLAILLEPVAAIARRGGSVVVQAQPAGGS
jgi:SAM-dependent methyltransferase